MKEKVLRNIVFMSLGKSVSLLGSSIYTFAMGLYVLKLTGSGLTFAVTLVLGTLPVILVNPLAGVIADRVNRKLIVVLADLSNGCLLFGLFFLATSAGLNLPSIYISIFLVNVVTVIFDISLEASIPDIVTGNRLIDMNSAGKAIEAATAVLGPMLGGIVYLFTDIRVFILANAFSFIFSAVMECFVDFRLGVSDEDIPKHSGDHQGLRIISDIKAGFTYMKGKGEVMGAFLFLTGLNFFIGYSVLVPLPYIINNVLILGPVNYGIIQAAFPVGALLGAILTRRWNYDKGYMRILYKAAVTLAAVIIFIAIPVLTMNINIPKTVLTACYGVIMGIMGVSAASIDIPLLYMLQTRLPGNLRGRVISLGMSLVKTASPLAFALSGILLDFMPVAVLPLSGGALLLFYTFAYRRRIDAVQKTEEADIKVNYIRD